MLFEAYAVFSKETLKLSYQKSMLRAFLHCSLESIAMNDASMIGIQSILRNFTTVLDIINKQSIEIELLAKNKKTKEHHRRIINKN